MIRVVLGLLVLVLSAVPALSQTAYPMLHDVTGVAEDDTLNVRAAPTTSAQILGTLAHDQTGIEVVGTDDAGKWGMVNVGETAGWAALRFLKPRPNPGDYALSRALRCFGTEPFWSLDLVQGQSAVLTQPDQPPMTFAAGLLSVSHNRTDRFVTGLGDGAVMVVSREACSDGMSDRLYGLGIDLIALRPGVHLRSGCCTIADE